MRNVSRLQSDRALTCSTSRSVRPYVDLFYLFPVVTDVPIYFAYGQCNRLVYSITALLIYILLVVVLLMLRCIHLSISSIENKGTTRLEIKE